MGEFYEKFQRGAFSEWLAAGNDVRGLYEHDHSMLLGRTRSGTLKLEEDETGLRFELTPPDTSTGRDVIELVKRGDISGMSFGFRSRKDVWDTTTDPCVRTVLVAELYEITVTSVPAYLIPAWIWPAVPCMSSTPKKCHARIIAAGGRI
ncbi:putative head maturation protease of prophage [Escherichia coli]|nr:putative head maturation protease of prophage [Escherichia coli]